MMGNAVRTYYELLPGCVDTDIKIKIFHIIIKKS